MPIEYNPAREYDVGNGVSDNGSNYEESLNSGDRAVYGEGTEDETQDRTGNGTDSTGTEDRTGNGTELDSTGELEAV